jgi:hypothetical protein
MLTTFTQIQDFLELKKATAAEYPTLTVLMAAMQQTFESYCSRQFDLKERTETFRVSDPDGETQFWLKGSPISSITSVNVTDSSGTITSLTEGTGYFLYSNRIEFLAEASKGSKVVIVYVGGLIDQTDETSFLETIPADLNLAAIQQISFQYQNRAKLAATSVSLDTNSIKIPALNLLSYTTDILDRYKSYGTGF